MPLFRIPSLFFAALLACSLGRAVPARAADINLHSSVSKGNAELGESIQFELGWTLSGQTQFSPVMEFWDGGKWVGGTPSFGGFQVRQGPMPQTQMSWINGAVSQTYNWVWELAPVKSGTLTLPKVRVRLKDATAGEIVKETSPLTVVVSKPKGFSLPPTPTAVPTEAAPEEALPPLKPDLGLPLAILGAAVLLVVGLAVLVLWLIFRPAKPKTLPVVRNPGQLALYELDQALRLLKAGRQNEYFLKVAAVLRAYLRNKLVLPAGEPTLMELQKGARRRFQPGPEASGNLDEVFDLLMRVLFGRHEATAAETAAFPEMARRLVLDLESLEKPLAEVS